MRHYLRVTEADFAKADSAPLTGASDVQSCATPSTDPVVSKAEIGGAKSGATLAQNPAQQASAGESKLWQELPQVLNKKGDMQNVAISCNILHTPHMEAGGIEPPSRDTSNPASTCVVEY